MRRSSIFLATALLAAVSIPAQAGHPVRHEDRSAGQGVTVPLDEARVVAFARPVSTVYVGNPVIADVTMIDKRHAFIQGKSFGVTNIIALDGIGRQISNSLVTVAGGGASVVTLQRGASQVTYACASARCEVAPQPGDGKEAFDSAIDQIAKHQSLIIKTASSATP